MALWNRGNLGPIERACIRSVLRQGHSLALYCYEEVGGIPDGVEVCDASTVLPATAIPQSWRQTRSDLYSDWFRYEIQKRGLGAWLDLDMYLLKPLDLDRPNLFGEYEPGKINGAVLRLPEDSPMLPLLLEPYYTGSIPRWLPWRWRAEGWARKIVTGTADLTRTPWGVTGPLALTAVASQLGLQSEALPVDAFYPVPWREAAWIRDPAVGLEDVTSSGTVAIHLWNECIKGFKEEAAAPGSFLARLQDEGRA